MYSWINTIPYILLQWLTLEAQYGEPNTKLPFRVYKNSPGNPAFYFYFLCTLILVLALIVIFTFQYQRWKKYKEFETEMQTLDLEPDQEGTLSEMVKRHSAEEPINILFSARLFDEMASEEIKRVLASPASAEVKQEFINNLYDIRTKTYHPDWLSTKFALPQEKPFPDVPSSE